MILLSLQFRMNLNYIRKMKKALLCLSLALFGSVSFAQNQSVGVMILAHGAGEQWNQQVLDATKPVAAKYPTEVAFGMALPSAMQAAVDKLEAAGVTKIVVVPLFISSHSFIIRQSEYLMGVREKLADPPMVMDHGTGGGHGSMNHGAPAQAGGHGGHGSAPASSGHDMHGSGHGQAAEATLAKLKVRAEVRFARPLDDNPLVAQILAQRIEALSTNPANETVILVGHGPNPEEDNKNWVRDMESLASQIHKLQEKSGKVSRMIMATTVRDDADPDMYNQAKENLRSLVRQASNQGTAIVVPVFLSSGSVEQKVASRLEGLTFKWNGKTLLPDERITTFIMQSVEGQLK